jgi:hypothetical protein
MIESISMDAHIWEFKGYTQRLSDIGLIIPSDIQVMIVLDSLPSAYLGYVQAITSRDIDITFE